MILKEVLTKIRNVLPFIAFGIGLESHNMASEARKARLEQAKEQTEKLIEAINTKNDLLISNQEFKNKVAGLTADISDLVDSINHNNKIVNNIVKEILNNPDINQREFISRAFNSSEQNIEKVKTTLHKIYDLILDDLNNKILSKDSINQLIIKYKEFLATLEVEQIAAVVNILGFVIVLSSLVSIAMVLFGDF
jgi:predicted patatin/cPLA2 family phospholipase